MDDVQILEGNVLETLKQIESGSVRLAVTSPPYYGLRAYLPAGHPLKQYEIGNEPTVEEYLNKMVAVFREVWRVLADDGNLYVNMGDGYWGGKGQSNQAWSSKNTDRKTLEKSHHHIAGKGETRPTDGKHPIIKPKDLIGVPWMLAFAMRADGWYLREDIIWHKPNPMPESVKDRCTRAHEYVFHFTKNRRYYYDNEAIKEPVTDRTITRISQENFDNQTGGEKDPLNGGDGERHRSARRGLEGLKRKQDELGKRQYTGFNERYFDKERKNFDSSQGGGGTGFKGHSGNRLADGTILLTRNKRSVWTISTKAYPDAHFATFPPDLIEPMILACSERGDTVLDPFGGSGTTAEVAMYHGRRAILCELVPEYIPLIKKRLHNLQPTML